MNKSPFDHYYRFKNPPYPRELYKKECRVIARFKKMNSVWVQFEE